MRSLAVALVALLVLAPPLAAEDAESSTRSRLTSLGVLGDRLSTIEARVSELEAELRASTNGSLRGELRLELEELRERRFDLERQFQRMAVGLELGEPVRRELDYEKELGELLSPVIRELKSLTERPRQMERLRAITNEASGRLPELTRALGRSDWLASESVAPETRRRLEELSDSIERRAAELKDQKRVAAVQLDVMNSGSKPLLETTQDFVSNFFKTRGRNLIMAFATLIAVFFFLRLSHRLVRKLSPFHGREQRGFVARVIDVGFFLVSSMGATLATLAVFYAAGDWLLLVLSLIFLVGLGWTARQGLPRVWRQVEMLLNLGGVREGERVIYADVPWRVESLNLHTHLENPELDVTLRLPLTAMFGLESRSCTAGEPWFPCRTGDWILLADGGFGRVIHQSHEQVVMELPGGSVKRFATAAFLSLAPTNLSRGFRVESTFGLDYALQTELLGELPEKLRLSLSEGLAQRSYGDALKSLKVELASASGSSLDLAIIADFDGAAAGSRSEIERALQQLAVAASERHGWSIPFPQVVVHRASATVA